MSNSPEQFDRNGANGRRSLTDGDIEIRKLKAILKRAVASESAPAELRDRIRRMIREK